MYVQKRKFSVYQHKGLKQHRNYNKYSIHGLLHIQKAIHQLPNCKKGVVNLLAFDDISLT